MRKWKLYGYTGIGESNDIQYASSALLQLFRYIVECTPGQILSYSIIDHTLQGRVNGQCVDFLGEYIIYLCGTERISHSNQIVYTL